MSTQTSHYNLVKPAGSEAYDVGVQNDNMDLIDAAMWAMPSTYKGIIGSSDDADSLPSDGIYYISDSLPLNVPSGMVWCFLYQVSNGAIKHQYIFRPVSGSIAIREKSGSPTAWQTWRKTEFRIYSINPTKVSNSKWTSGTITIRKKNGWAFLKIDGAVFSAIPARETIATIPTEYRPVTESYFFSSDGTRQFLIDTAGNVKAGEQSAGTVWGSGAYMLAE